MEVLTLGAGQEVGRSCIIVSIDDKTVMLDCGMHMGYNDWRKFPDFRCLSNSGDFNSILSCIIISHFHLDHCGALPYFTEILGYSGPIFMTHPTLAVLPSLLEDSCRILQLKSSQGKSYGPEDIENCLKKVVPIHMNETYEISDGFWIRPYYAGHVIGAAIFHVSINGRHLIYTGDFSTTADRHMGAAKLTAIRPDLLICESTYGGVIHDFRKSKERQFIQLIHGCIKRDGVVLIPIFALGRAQEMCLIVDSYWERLGWNVPVYFSGGLTQKANKIYKRFISYTNESVQRRIRKENVFEFKSIHPYEMNAELNGPCVIFSSPAMLHHGHSLRIFKNICENKRNLVILPGYCLRGTVGERVLAGAKRLNIMGENKEINLQIENLAFSAHADTPGILRIIQECEPQNVLLVHGDKSRMNVLKQTIEKELRLMVYMPENGNILKIPNSSPIPIRVLKEKLKTCAELDKAEQEITVLVDLEVDIFGGKIANIEKFTANLDEGNKFN